MKMKKCLSILLAVVMIATMITSLPITAIAADVDTAGVGEGTVLPVDDATALEAACKEINDGAGGTYTISLTKNIENGQVVITNPNAVVTVIGNGKTITTTKQSAVYVANGATVNLGNGETELTLSGKSVFIEHEETANDEPGLVYILSGSTCNMDEKVTLRDRTGNNYFGGGVTVQGGTFIMNGGTIENCGIDGGSVCYGGGVAVFNSGYFEMNGGTITGCYAKSDYPPDHYDQQYTAMGGGVFVTGGSVFLMNGGTISNCEATNFGGGVAVVGARQINNFKSKFTLIKGTISGNKASGGAGIFASGYHYAEAVAISMTATIDDAPNAGSGSQSGSAESGTPNAPGLYINGGLITHNTATGTYDATVYLFAKGLGGGILVSYNNSNLFQIHNAIITFNNAEYGAGIASFYSNTNADINGCEITDNTSQKNGGGVYLTRNNASSKTTIKNTTINGNKSGDRGAGVYYDAKSKLYISGANVIQNNEYNGTLNNLNVLSVDYPVYVDGALTGSQIGLSDPSLWDDGVSDIEAPDDGAAELLTSGYKENNPDVHPSEYFTSDHETWVVERSAKTTTEIIDTSSKTRYQFTAKRYSVIDKGRPAGLLNQLIIRDIKNPDLKDKNNLSINEIIEELKYPFSDNTKYSSSGGIYSNGAVFLKYFPLDSGSPFSQIIIRKGPTDTKATIEYDVANNGGYVTYTASTSNQSNYANTGELVLEITQPNTITTTFNAEPDTIDGTKDTTIEYLTSRLPSKFNGILYDYDENGYITAKYEIEDNTGTPVQNKIIIEGGEDEVRLVRKKTVDYHINNDVIDDKYDNSDIFTDEITAGGTTITVGETITSFYTVPEPATDEQHSCPYIFKGWYYDKANDNNSRPVKFDVDVYIGGKDIYAHWIEVNDVAKDSRDPYGLPNGYTAYGGFDLAGVQIREDRTRDSNFDGQSMPGGMRFITSLSMDVVNEINSIQENNIKYGYVAANATNDDWITYHNKAGRKLQYASENTNGVNTVSDDPDITSNDNYFAFATNINCTSERISTDGVVANDHRNYNGYLLYTLVITYEGEDASAFDKNVLARPYIKYTDANGLVRVAYSDYRGTSNTLGGCYTSYNVAQSLSQQEEG